MKKKNPSKSVGGLIIWLGIILFFIFPPVGFMFFILGIITSIAGGSPKRTTTDTIQHVYDNKYKPQTTSPSSTNYYTNNHQSQETIDTYTYTTSHTGQAVEEKRNTPIQGIITLETTDIGSAIGLIRLARKLVGIKHIELHIKTERKTPQELHTASPKEAIKHIRKAYAERKLKGITLKIYPNKNNSELFSTLIDIAQSTYQAHVA